MDLEVQNAEQTKLIIGLKALVQEKDSELIATKKQLSETRIKAKAKILAAFQKGGGGKAAAPSTSTASADDDSGPSRDDLLAQVESLRSQLSDLHIANPNQSPSPQADEQSPSPLRSADVVESPAQDKECPECVSWRDELSEARAQIDRLASERNEWEERARSCQDRLQETCAELEQNRSLIQELRESSKSSRSRDLHVTASTDSSSLPHHPSLVAWHESVPCQIQERIMELSRFLDRSCGAVNPASLDDVDVIQRSGFSRPSQSTPCLSATSESIIPLYYPSDRKLVTWFAEALTNETVKGALDELTFGPQVQTDPDVALTDRFLDAEMSPQDDTANQLVGGTELAWSNELPDAEMIPGDDTANQLGAEMDLSNQRSTSDFPVDSPVESGVANELGEGTDLSNQRSSFDSSANQLLSAPDLSAPPVIFGACSNDRVTEEEDEDEEEDAELAALNASTPVAASSASTTIPSDSSTLLPSNASFGATFTFDDSFVSASSSSLALPPAASSAAADTLGWSGMDEVQSRPDSVLSESGRMSRLSAERDSLVVQNEQLHTCCERLETSITTLERDSSFNKNQMGSLEEENNALKALVEGLGEHVRQLEGVRNHRADQLSSLEASKVLSDLLLVSTQKERDSALSELTTIENNIQGTVSELQLLKEAFRTELCSAEGARSRMESDFLRLSETCRKLGSDNVRLCEKLEVANSDLALSVQAKERIESELVDTTEHCTVLERDLTSANDSNTRLVTELSSLKERLEALSKDAETEVLCIKRAFDSQISSVENDQDSLESCLREKEEELTELQAFVSDQNEEIERLKSELAFATEKLNQVNASVSQISPKFPRILEEVQCLGNRISQHGFTMSELGPKVSRDAKKVSDLESLCEVKTQEVLKLTESLLCKDKDLCSAQNTIDELTEANQLFLQCAHRK